MEFDNQTSTTVSDEARRQAEMRRLTLHPLHGDVTPEDIPDSELTAQHVNAGPLANTPNDTEETTRVTNATTELMPPRKRLAAGFAIAGVVGGCGVIALTLLYVMS